MKRAASCPSSCSSPSPPAGAVTTGRAPETVARSGELHRPRRRLADRRLRGAGDRFEEEHDVDVAFSFGSSTDLAEQVADGAPGDVLATADSTSMGLAEDAGVTGEVETFATNVLTIVVPKGNPAGIASLDDLGPRRGCAAPTRCRAARSRWPCSSDNGITAEPASLEEDVRATLDKVVSGEADAGLVYATDAVAAGDDVDAVEIPGAEADLTSYYATTLEQSENADLAADWVAWVTSEEGQAILADAGFGSP